MLEHNLDEVRRRIAKACVAAGRDPAEVRLLLATKQVPAGRVAEAVRLGATLIGENRVQELAAKDPVLAPLDCERHFIGRLQTNKVNQVLRYVTCVHSIDRIDLADRLQRRLDTLDQAVDVLVQVNTSNEQSKGGVPPERAETLVRDVARHDRLRVKGLMTIGPLAHDAGQVRTAYRMLRQIRDDIAETAPSNVHLDVLSMGMSGDFEHAIAEGSTLIRVGSAVFGSRRRE